MKTNLLAIKQGFSYWSEFGGLRRETLGVKIREGNISLIEEDIEHLVRYRSGVMF